MPKYRVKFESVAYIEIEADSMDDALDRAENRDLDAEQLEKLGWELYNNADLVLDEPMYFAVEVAYVGSDAILNDVAEYINSTGVKWDQDEYENSVNAEYLVSNCTCALVDFESYWNVLCEHAEALGVQLPDELCEKIEEEVGDNLIDVV